MVIKEDTRSLDNGSLEPLSVLFGPGPALRGGLCWGLLGLLVA